MKKSRQKLPALTGLRFFAAITAATSNLCLWRDVDPGFGRFIEWGWLDGILKTPFRVDLFFLLSGFLLTYLYSQRFQEKCSLKDILKFYFIRFTRIYPLHFFVLIFILILNFYGLWKYGSFDVYGRSSANRIYADGSLITNFSLTAAWGFNEYKLSWNGPAWSLSTEWLNYLAFPVISFLFIYLKKTWHYLIAIALVLLNYYLTVEIQNYTYDADNGLSAILRSLTGFTLGGLCAGVYDQTFSKKINWDHIFTATGFILFILLIFYKKTYGFPFITIYLLLPLLILSLAKSNSYIERFFSKDQFVYLGKISFAVYMLHQPVFRLIGYFLRDVYNKIDSTNQVLLLSHLILSLSILILTSMFVFHFIEDPIRMFFRKRLKT